MFDSSNVMKNFSYKSNHFFALSLARLNGQLDYCVGSWQLAVGSWQLAVGSWQLAVGSWQLAVSSQQSAVGSQQLVGIVFDMVQLNRTQNSL
jgi:hypothetical protein